MIGISSSAISSADVVLGHLDVGGQRRAAEDAQVDVADDVPRDALRLRDALRGLEFDRVALAVAEAQRVGLEALVLRDRQHGGRVESSAQQHDCLARHVITLSIGTIGLVRTRTSKLHARVAANNDVVSELRRSCRDRN